MSEPKLLPDANDLPGDRLKEDEVVWVVLSDLGIHKVVPGIQLWIRKDTSQKGSVTILMNNLSQNL